MCKASHRGSKQQERSPDEITLLLLVRATYIYIFVLRAHPVRGELHNQRNTTGEVAAIALPVVVVFLLSTNQQDSAKTARLLY